jgi:hypothetical protein
MRGQQRQQAQLGAGQRRGSHGASAGGGQPRLQLLCLPGEDTEIGPPLKDLPRLPQRRPGPGGVVERQVSAGELQQRLDGVVGQCVAEQPPQASRPRQVLVGPRQVVAVHGYPCDHRVGEGT